MKKTITVPTWTLDNSGTYHAPGTELKIGDKGTDGYITTAAAKAIDAVEAQRSPKPATAKAKRQRTAKPKTVTKAAARAAAVDGGTPQPDEGRAIDRPGADDA